MIDLPDETRTMFQVHFLYEVRHQNGDVSLTAVGAELMNGLTMKAFT